MSVVHSFKEVLINSSLKVAIVNDSEEGVTEEQGALIQNAITRELMNLMLKGGSSVKFDGIDWKGDHVLATCSDLASKNWLEDTISKLENLWVGCKLKCTAPAQIPKRFPVIVYIPDNIAIENDTDIVKMLHWQNSTVGVNTWKQWGHFLHPQTKTRRLAFGVDTKFTEALRGLGGKLFYLTGKVKFNLPQDKKTGLSQDEQMETEVASAPIASTSNKDDAIATLENETRAEESFMSASSLDSQNTITNTEPEATVNIVGGPSSFGDILSAAVQFGDLNLDLGPDKNKKMHRDA